MGIAAPLGVSASGKPPAGDQANAVISGVLANEGPGKPFAFLGPLNLVIYAEFNTTLTTVAGSLAATVAAAGVLAKGNSVNSVNVPRGTTIAEIAGLNITMAIPPIALPGKTSTKAAQITDLPSTDGLLGATVTGPGIPAATTVTAIAQAAVPPNAAGNGAVLGIVALNNIPTEASVISEPVFFEFTRTANAITVTGADPAAKFTGAEIVWDGTVQVERSFDGAATWLPCNLGGSGTLAQFTDSVPISVTFGEPEKQVLYRLNAIDYDAIANTTLNYRISQLGAAATSLSIGTSI